MGRIAAAIALLGATYLSLDAAAATLSFQAVQTDATAICIAPCFEIRMFYEDSTRSLPIQALQFDVDIFGSVTVPSLPIPPAVNSNAAGGNVFALDSEGGLVTIPWDLSSTVGRSPDVRGDGLDALIVDASTDVAGLTVDSIQTVLADSVGCVPSARCAILQAGLVQNRVYLGRFNVTWEGGPVAMYVAGITGVGPGASDPVDGIERLDGNTLTVEGLPSFGSQDSDRDGVVDDQDNCPSIPNATQEDRDSDGVGDICDPCDFSTPGQIDTDGNGIEDGCECGDQTGDGRVDMLDLIGINLAIFGQAMVSPLCDTNYDGLCNVQDIVGAHNKIFGQPAYCSRYPPPGPQAPGSL